MEDRTSSHRHGAGDQHPADTDRGRHRRQNWYDDAADQRENAVAVDQQIGEGDASPAEPGGAA